MELTTTRSTWPITHVTTHEGIVTTTVFDLRMPDLPPDQGWRIAP
jgi:hypothetical protein